MDLRQRFLCPWHHERTPSLHVDVQTRTFICFGCGKTGTAEELYAKLDEVKPIKENR
jgi:DNA primase